jgi:hypothetical protein
MPGRDLTDIRSERIASSVEERHIAFPIIAGIVGFALVVAYAGYCFYSTAEMIKPYKKTDPSAATVPIEPADRQTGSK